jgi:hypothetical protein
LKQAKQLWDLQQRTRKRRKHKNADAPGPA